MKKTISLSEFKEAFKDLRPNNFSDEGLVVLFEYLTDLEEETNKEFELDVIAFCCEYNEYADIKEYLKDYSNQHEEKTIPEKGEDWEDFKERIEREIRDNTLIIPFGSDLDDGFIIQAY